MVMKLRLASLLFACLAFMPSNMARAENPLDSSYDGAMAIDGNSFSVPLQLQLHQTEELEQITTSAGTYSQYRIDGSFIVDDEGGPYKFARVTVDYETGELDMRYSRGGTPSDQPTSLRLSGFLQPNHSIKGTVYSGLGGNIGTFTLTQRPNLILKTRPKYVGHWVGKGVLLSTGAQRSIEIKVESNQNVSANPETMELGFSLGKNGAFLLNTIPIPYPIVVVDYLRHTFVMMESAGSDTGSTVQMSINPNTGDIAGYTTGIYGGKTIEFTLKRNEGGPL